MRYVIPYFPVVRNHNHTRSFRRVCAETEHTTLEASLEVLVSFTIYNKELLVLSLLLCSCARLGLQEHLNLQSGKYTGKLSFSSSLAGTPSSAVPPFPLAPFPFVR